MRLLDTEFLELKEFSSEEIPPYAILSHRWGKEEVTFQDIQLRRHHHRHGFDKLLSFCSMASLRGFSYAWSDTCCINKESSAKLQESINSMFRWYQDAKECYAFLHDVVGKDNPYARDRRRQFATSEWFKRGWTLQELIAPQQVLFFDSQWNLIGQKSSMYHIISAITYIDRGVLEGKKSLQKCTVSERMSWAARRKTTRIEDQAYSLLGLFNIYMPLLYGEKEQAFRRLQEEIIKQSDDHTLFIWSSSNFAKSILAPYPDCFGQIEGLVRLFPTNDTSLGYTLVNAGLLIQLELIPWTMNTYLAPLNCGSIPSYAQALTQSSIRGYHRACIFLQRTEHESHFIRVAVADKDYQILDGDTIAEMRDRYGFKARQVLVRQFNETTYTKPAQPSFYGFVFNFHLQTMFAGAAIPHSADVLNGQRHWKLDEQCCRIMEGKHHSAGLFRLTGFPGLYMYLGFDTNFSPLCLITMRSPRSKHYSLLPSDFGQLSENEATELLDLDWLRSQVSLGANNAETVLALKIDRPTKTNIECQNLDMLIEFEWKYSQRVRLHAWEVTFSPITDSSPMMSYQGLSLEASSTTPPFESSQQFKARGELIYPSNTKSSDNNIRIRNAQVRSQNIYEGS